MVATILAPRDADDAISSLLLTQPLGREHGFEPLRVEGKLPARLRGTLYRNGPGQGGLFGKRYSHVFEGDGAGTAIRIADGKALGASRLHATAGLQRERATGKMLYGLSASWPRRIANVLLGRQKNLANTSMLAWQGRLFALFEIDLPTELDPRDLSTIGPTDLGMVRTAFSAHPHRVAARRATYNFGVEFGRKTKLHLYELPDTGSARRLGEVVLGYTPMVHDFVATESHLIFFVSPVRIDIPRMLLQRGPFDQLFQWKPEKGTEVIAVSIDRPDDVVRFTTDAFYQWHFANAFSRGGEIVVDYIRYPNLDSLSALSMTGRGVREALSGRFHRATLDLAAKTFTSEALSDRAVEFPSVLPGEEGREHSMMFGVFDVLSAIGSIDARGKVSAHQLPAGEFTSEPLYVDGYLLALCHVPDAAYLGVYDVARIPDGPIAKIWLDHHVPLTYHGTFVRG